MNRAFLGTNETGAASAYSSQKGSMEVLALGLFVYSVLGPDLTLKHLGLVGVYP